MRKNKEMDKDYKRQYYLKNKDKLREHFRNYYLQHKTQIILREQNRRRKAKLELMQLLGGKCIKCGESDCRCLQIDHVKGCGTLERKKLGNGRYIFIVLKKVKEDSKDYQLLCANCNWKKRFDNNEHSWRME